MDTEVKTRLVEGLGSCGHMIKKDEKYLVERGSYYGHPSNKSYCKNCAKDKLKEMFKSLIIDVKDLELEETLAESIEEMILPRTS